MRVENSNLLDDIIIRTEESLGNLYFLSNLLITEFNEGAHISLKSTELLIKKIEKFYGNKRFGVICNRVFPYSIVPLEIAEFKTVFKNLSAYAVVGHNKAGLMNVNIENNFCKSNDVVFDDLITAVNWMEDKLQSISLN